MNTAAVAILLAEKTASNAEAVGAAAAVLSLVAALAALYFQVQSLNRTMQSSTYQEIVRMFDDFSKLIIDNPELDGLIFGSAAPTSEDQRAKAKWALAIRFDWFESIVIQKHRYEAIPLEIYHHWLNVLKAELNFPAVKKYWEENGSFYHPDLQYAVSNILLPPPPPHRK